MTAEPSAVPGQIVYMDGQYYVRVSATSGNYPKRLPPLAAAHPTLSLRPATAPHLLINQTGVQATASSTLTASEHRGASSDK